MQYKVSKYNINVDTGNDTLIMYNTRTGSILSVDKDNIDNVKAILDNPNEYNNNNSQILKENGFIIDESMDELRVIKEKNEEYRNIDNFLSVTLMPAEYCNCKCPYCFVYSYRNKVMSETVYNNVYDLLMSRLKLYKGDKKFVFSLEWFGGEPTLELEEVIKFTNRINDLKKEYDFTCKVNIITNGYLLNYDNFKSMLDAGISRFQITFDGDKEYHDTLRILKNDEGTFDVIFNNIKQIKELASKDDKFSLDIRINFLKKTTKSVYNLIDKLAEFIGDDRRFSIYCRPIYNIETTRDDINQLESDIYSIEEGTKVQTDLAFYIKKKLGVKDLTRIFDPLPKPTAGWCRFDGCNSYIVGADGDVFLCDTNIGDEFSLGKLSSNGEINYNNKGEDWRKSVFEFNDMDKCLECKTLPICMGGCRRVRIMNKENPCFWTESNIIETIQKYYVS